MKQLTIGMATYDDFDGVYFSLQALRLYHPSIDVQYIVVDNNPDSVYGVAVEKLLKQIPNALYVKCTDKQSTSVRDLIFQHAQGKYTVCMDSHVMFAADAITELLKYYNDNPDTNNLVSGPMLYDNLKRYATHFDPIWGELMYGKWGSNQEECNKGNPFEIEMMGLGVFSCRTAAWPGFNTHFKGFGGEEGYIHEKFRMKGGKCICLPGFKWLHRFSRPNGVPYPNVIADRVWNYYVGWLELLKDKDHPFISKITEVFSKILPLHTILDIRDKAMRLYQ